MSLIFRSLVPPALDGQKGLPCCSAVLLAFSYVAICIGIRQGPGYFAARPTASGPNHDRSCARSTSRRLSRAAGYNCAPSCIDGVRPPRTGETRSRAGGVVTQNQELPPESPVERSQAFAGTSPRWWRCLLRCGEFATFQQARGGAAGHSACEIRPRAASVAPGRMGLAEPIDIQPDRGAQPARGVRDLRLRSCASCRSGAERGELAAELVCAGQHSVYGTGTVPV